MSRPRKLTDSERTCTMLDLVHRTVSIDTNGGAPSHVVIEEVAPGVGWSGAMRWADVLVLGMWPSKGLTLEGYEVKASKADLKKELRDPAKHRATARYCDYWWLVVWDESLLVEGIPETWGVLVTIEDEDGERELKVLKKATKLEPLPWPRAFVCSLVRNAHQQSPGAAYVARATVAAGKRGMDDGRQLAESETRRALAPLRDILFADKDHWMKPNDAETIIRAACDRLKQGSLDLGT